jgi:hypothetical protein
VISTGNQSSSASSFSAMSIGNKSQPGSSFPTILERFPRLAAILDGWL